MAGQFSVGSLAATFLPYVFMLFVILSHDARTFGSYFAVLTAIILGLGLLAWMNSPRPGEVLVWISSAGIGQQNDFDPYSLTAKLRRIVPILSILVYVGLMQQGSIVIVIVWILCITLFVLCTQMAKRRSDRQKIASRANGIQPDILDWRFARPEVRTLAVGKYRLRVERPSKIQKTYTVDIRFEATADFMKHLEAQMKVWQTERERSDQLRQLRVSYTSQTSDMA